MIFNAFDWVTSIHVLPGHETSLLVQPFLPAFFGSGTAYTSETQFGKSGNLIYTRVQISEILFWLRKVIPF